MDSVEVRAREPLGVVRRDARGIRVPSETAEEEGPGGVQAHEEDPEDAWDLVKAEDAEDEGLRLLREAGDGPISLPEYRVLVGKLKTLLADLSKTEGDLIWAELFAEPLHMLAPKKG